MQRSMMAFGPHCDDIEFQYGATLLKYHREYGYRVVYVEMTNNMHGGWAQYDGIPPLPEDCPRQATVRDGHITDHTVPWQFEMPQRKKEAREAARMFFDTEPVELDYPQGAYRDTDLRDWPEGYGVARPACVAEGARTILTACKDPREVARVRDLILREDPEIIFSMNVVDLNPEHCACAVLVLDAFREARKAGYRGSMVYPAPLNPTGFARVSDMWETFTDTTGYEAEKRRAIGVHACQMPDPARLDLMDRLHGELCGCGEAEAWCAVHLSEEAEGELTAELRENRRYCREHFEEMFLSEKSRRLYEAFCRRVSGNY